MGSKRSVAQEINASPRSSEKRFRLQEGETMISKKVLLAFAAALAVGLGTVAVVGGKDVLSLNGATGSGSSCASITFGALMGTSTNISTQIGETDLAMFKTNGVDVSSLSGITNSYIYQGSGYKYTTTAASYACRIGKSSANGSLTFNFSSAYTINSARVYAATYGSKTPSLTVKTSSFTAGASNTVSNTSLSGVDDLASNSATYYEFTGLNANGTSTSLTLAGKYIAVFKIVLNLTGGASSSAASSSSSSSSSSEALGAQYKLVTSQDGIAAGKKYVVGSTGTAGSAYFLGTEVVTATGNTNTYKAGVSATINSDLTMNVTSVIDEFTLGGAADAYTFQSTKVSGNGYLFCDSSVTAPGGLSLTSDAARVDAQWKITVSSTGAATVINGATKGRYLEYFSTYTEFSTYATSCEVYLFAEVAA